MSTREKKSTYAYVDASYHPQLKIGCWGFRLQGQHTNEGIQEFDGVASAEKMALAKCISYCKCFDIKPVIIYTDHMGSLSHKNNYPDWVDVRFIKGHKKRIDKSEHDLEFTIIDRSVRKTLRKYIKENHS